jgi:cell division septal protein FtsQ
METKIPSREPASIPETRKRFMRATALWIYLPVCAGVLAALGLMIGITAGGSGGRMQAWSQLATVLMAAMLIAAGVAGLIFLVTAAIGIGMLVDRLPRYSVRMRRVTTLAARQTRRASDLAAEPFLFLAEVQAMGGSILEFLGDSVARTIREKGEDDG